MKRVDLEKRLRKFGFIKISGAKHDKWKLGSWTEMVPRHSEINEYTAKAILKRAKQAASDENGL